MNCNATAPLVAGAVSLAALLAVGAPLIAQSGPYDPPANGKGPVQTKPVKPSPPKAKPKAKPARTTFFATLLGRNEIGTDGKSRAGDLDGQGGATVVTTDHAAVLRGRRPGHRHPERHARAPRPPKRKRRDRGAADPRRPGGDPGASAGCVDVASALLQEITKHPIRFYVNIHTSDFQNGALRGQLHRAPRRR